MKFITENKDLRFYFKDLCHQYHHFKWAVACAGDPDFDIGELLKKNESKIEEIVIGLHFYQTSPRFIEQYMDNPRVRYKMLSDGSFHSNVYLFYNKPSKWKAIIGSSNFTHQSFHVNSEACILISNEDEGITFGELSSFVSWYWRKAEQFSEELFERYEKNYAVQSKKISSLVRVPVKIKRKITDFEMMSWRKYVEKLNNSDNDLEMRIALLNKASEIFKEGKPFDALDVDTKRALAGFPRKGAKISEHIDWKLFGSMVGAGDFRHDILHDIKIGKALDKIPFKGRITKDMFLEFCKAFNKSNPIGCATRLLAVKRPDIFVPVNNKNKRMLSKMLNIPQSDFNIENYWDILGKIHDTVWVSDNAYVQYNDMEKKWYQVALLDALTYEK